MGCPTDLIPDTDKSFDSLLSMYNFNYLRIYRNTFPSINYDSTNKLCFFISLKQCQLWK